MKTFRFNSLLRLLSFSLLIFLAGWILILGGVSFTYTYGLTHPFCPPSISQLPGFQSVNLITSDELKLDGWWYPPSNGAVILLLGGHGANRDAMLPEADLLINHGYGILTIEYRSCAGVQTTLGFQEVNDLGAMINYAQSQVGVNWLGTLGFSAGGVTAILGAAHYPEIRAVIAEGNYANLLDEFTAVRSAPLSLEWQIQRFVVLSYWLQTGIWPGNISPIHSLPQISPRPLLLIHGEYEEERSQAMAQFDASLPPHQLWIVPSSGHGGYLQAQPIEYELRIIEFFESSRYPSP